MSSKWDRRVEQFNQPIPVKVGYARVIVKWLPELTESEDWGMEDKDRKDLIGAFHELQEATRCLKR